MILGIISDVIFFKMATTVTTGHGRKKHVFIQVLTCLLLVLIMFILSNIHQQSFIASNVALEAFFALLTILIRFFFITMIWVKIGKIPWHVGILASLLAESFVFLLNTLSGGIYWLNLLLNSNQNPAPFVMSLYGIALCLQFMVKSKWIQLFHAILKTPILKTMIYIMVSFYYVGVLLLIPLATESSINHNLLILMPLVIISLLMITFTILLILLPAKQKVHEKVVENQAFVQYANEMERQYDTIRGFKHDHANIMLAFNHLIDQENISGLRKFYYENMNTLLPKDMVEGAYKDIATLKVPEVKSLILSKMHLATVSVYYEGHQEISEIPMNMVDFLRIVGIVLDNAIEEVAACSFGDVRIGFKKSDDALVFLCKNHCRNPLPNIYQLKMDGFSTKGRGRGIGLKNLDDIISQYDTVFLETTIEHGEFIQCLTMEKQNI